MSNARQLFKCNSLKQHKRNQDYEYIGYGYANTTASIQEEEPMSSTAIFTSKYKPLNNLKNISIITRIDESTTSDENNDVEKTRNQQISTIHSIPNCISPHKLIYDGETVIASQNDSSFSNVFLLNTSLESNRSTNEMVYLQSTKIAVTNEIYSPPSNQSSLDSPVSSTFIENYSNNMNAYQELLNNVIIKLRTTQASYICVDDYEATFVDDISIISGDFVDIVNNSNEEWLLVRVLNGENQLKQGYVPRQIVCEINVYVDYLREKINLLKLNSKSSLVSLPVSV